MKEQFILTIQANTNTGTRHYFLKTTHKSNITKEIEIPEELANRIEAFKNEHTIERHDFKPYIQYTTLQKKSKYQKN